MMETRAAWLDYLARGLQATHIDLIGLRDDGEILPLPLGDDEGLYLIAPRLALWVGADPVLTAHVLLGALVIAGGVIAAVFFVLSFRSWRARIAVLVTSWALVTFGLAIGDVYAIGVATTLWFLPLAFWIRAQGGKDPWRVALMLLGSGLIAGTMHIIRSNSALPLVGLLTIAILLDRAASVQRRALYAIALCAPILIPIALNHIIVERRDSFILTRVPDYLVQDRSHPVWYVAYMGLGFLDNPYGIRFSDDSAAAAVVRYDPHFFDDPRNWNRDYRLEEAILRRATFDVVFAHPLFILRTCFAKFGVMAMFFILACNVWLPVTMRRRKPDWFDWGAWFAIGYAMLPGLIALPTLYYLTSFISTSALYGASRFALSMNAVPER